MHALFHFLNSGGTDAQVSYWLFNAINISPGVSKTRVRSPILRGTTLFGELVGLSPGNIRVTPSTSFPRGSLYTTTILELCCMWEGSRILMTVH